MTDFEQWKGFEQGKWCDDIDTRDFIQKNYTPYDGDESFLAGPTDATNKLWGKLQELQKEERAKGGVLDMDTHIVTGINAHKPGYIDESMKDLEKIVGLQTDKPLKRAFMPFGGIKMAEEACSTYGYEPDPELHKIFTQYHKTHNQGVFDVYTPEMRAVRKNKTIVELLFTVLICLSQRNKKISLNAKVNQCLKMKFVNVKKSQCKSTLLKK